MTSRPAPTATYRLQLGADLDFAAARALVDELGGLGISHLYLSPVLQAAPGSTHGYDTADHGTLSAELGGRRAFDELATAAVGAGMGLVVDVVPNHMSIADARANRWWWDVLEHGPSSRYADHFDITWESHEVRQRDTVLLPVLGDHYGRVLDAGELVLDHTDDGFVARYFDHVFPLSPESIAAIVRPAADADGIPERLAAVNADVDRLHEILELQHYQLCHWRRARHDLDYRRFFDIDTLIGVRVEDPQVFADTHALVLELVDAGLVDGLRIDHPDGLSDPAGYLERLASAADGAWTAVEKILEPGEPLPDTWPVAGTTGYDFAHVVGGLRRPPTGVATLTDWWHRHVDAAPWEDVVIEAKREIVTTVLSADVARLADVGVRLCERHRRHRDHTRHDVTETLRALLVAFPVYRTYVVDGVISDRDRSVVEIVRQRARRAAEVDGDLVDFLGEVLVGGHAGQPIADEFVRRFQQLTGPAMAKSVEDTAFYRYLPVPSANEVGGDPGHPSTSIATFHDHNLRMHDEWPETMTALSTHDTKRSADVRARLDVCTEVADVWVAFLDRWVKWCDERWEVAPDPATSSLILHTMVGAWPIDGDRLRAYVEKATKEAKRRTNWTDPDPAYDAAAARVVDLLLANEALVADIGDLIVAIRVPGRIGALGQQLLQLTSPGVPDVYQGSELWDLSLVDPDNRRPVDHALRERLLGELRAGAGPDVPIEDDDLGVHKLWLTHLALDLRRRRPGAFGPGNAGEYRPLEVGDHGVAFARGDSVIVAATVRPATGRPFEVPLPDGRWVELVSGAEHRETIEVETVALVERLGS